MYVSNFGTYVSLLGMYFPNFGTKLLPQRKNFYSTVLQLFKHYVSEMSQVYRKTEIIGCPKTHPFHTYSPKATRSVSQATMRLFFISIELASPK